MKNFLSFISESKELRVDQIGKKNLNNITFIAFDTETTGLHRYQGKHKSLKLVFPKIRENLIKYYKDAENLSTDDAKGKAYEILKKVEVELQLAEIAAIAFTLDGTEKDRFHKYVRFDKSGITERVYRLIQWDYKKTRASNSPETVLKEFGEFISKQNNPMLIAHNAPFDLSLVKRLAVKHGANNTAQVLRNTKFIDTRKTTKLREIFPDLFPWRETEKGRREVNSQKDLIAAFNITNNAAHTALEDVTALKKLFLKLYELART